MGPGRERGALRPGFRHMDPDWQHAQRPILAHVTQLADGRVFLINFDAKGEVYDPVTGVERDRSDNPKSLSHCNGASRRYVILLGGGTDSLFGADHVMILATQRKSTIRAPIPGPLYSTASLPPNRSCGNGAAKRQGPGRWRQDNSLRRGPASLGPLSPRSSTIRRPGRRPRRTPSSSPAKE